MTTFIGFSTIGKLKKFTLTDDELVLRDFLNSLNIKAGSLPGRPSYGTEIWNYLFEPQLDETPTQIENEMRRLVSLDPRLAIDQLDVYPQQNGVLIELAVRTVSGVDAQLLSIFFDAQQQRAVYL